MTQGGRGQGLPRLGNYQLMRAIGRGGFADVYLARHVNLKSYAAVKILKADFPTQELIEEFLAEAQTIAELTHVNIIRVLDFAVQDDIAFLVMDYAPYGSLRTQYALHTQIPMDAVLSYVRQVASALQYAHQHRIIHCDVKPENMLIAKDYHILLSDFGLATVSAISQSIQPTGEVAGTIAYIAPEQLRGKPRPASDQYSLAVTAYEWLCGRRPFVGSITEVMAQHVESQPAPLHIYASEVPVGVEQVVLQALEKDPRQRFQSVLEFSEALDAAAGVRPRRPQQEHFTTQIGNKPTAGRETAVFPQSSGRSRSNGSIRASKPSQPESNRDLASVRTVLQGTPEGMLPEDEVPTRRLSRRNLLILAAGIVGGGGVAATIAAFAFHGSPSQVLLTTTSTATATPTKAASKPTATATPTKAAAKPTPTATEPPAQPTPTATEPAGPAQPAGTVLQFTSIGASVFSVAWRPGGTLVAIGNESSTLLVDNLTSSTLQHLLGHTGAINSVAWSPNGSMIASASTDKTVRVWNTGSGALLVTCQGHTGAVNSASWSPDGTRIVSGGADKTVRIWNAGSGALLVTNADHTGTVTSVAWSPDGSMIASASTDGSVQIWNAQTGNKIAYRGHTGAVNSVAWSPDGTSIVSGGADTTAQVYTVTGSLQETYKEHTGAVNSVAWSLDGTRIVSGGADVTVQIWNATTGTQQYSFGGHFATVHSAAWSPDGTRVVSCSDDQTVQVWQA